MAETVRTGSSSAQLARPAKPVDKQWTDLAPARNWQDGFLFLPRRLVLPLLSRQTGQR
jgi:hypothetical protein